VTCDASWKAWVTALRKDSLQRLKSARPTSASDYSSSRTYTEEGAGECWPTPDAAVRTGFNQGGANGRIGPRRPLLATAAEMGLTPNVPNGGRSVPEETVLAKGQTGGGKRQIMLEQQARYWETPARSASAWPTPTSRDWKDGACAEADVPTNGLLGRAAVRWLTPDTNPERPNMGSNKMGDKSLLAQAETCLHSLPAPPTSTPGATSSPQTRRLNPRFVEILMGWPVGWTGLDSAATAWSHWWPRMRSALSSLD
jgi:hypothetical protein